MRWVVSSDHIGQLPIWVFIYRYVFQISLWRIDSPISIKPKIYWGWHLSSSKWPNFHKFPSLTGYVTRPRLNGHQNKSTTRTPTWCGRERQSGSHLEFQVLNKGKNPKKCVVLKMGAVDLVASDAFFFGGGGGSEARFLCNRDSTIMRLKWDFSIGSIRDVDRPSWGPQQDVCWIFPTETLFPTRCQWLESGWSAMWHIGTIWHILPTSAKECEDDQEEEKKKKQ